jgi:hypothetical protein
MLLGKICAREYGVGASLDVFPPLVYQAESSTMLLRRGFPDMSGEVDYFARICKVKTIGELVVALRHQENVEFLPMDLCLAKPVYRPRRFGVAVATEAAVAAAVAVAAVAAAGLETVVLAVAVVVGALAPQQQRCAVAGGWSIRASAWTGCSVLAPILRSAPLRGWIDSAWCRVC